jgi:hypothetical protein
MPNNPRLAFVCRADKGNVVVFISKDGKLGEGLGMPASKVGDIAATLLMTAKTASEQAGLAPFADGSSLVGVHVLPVSRIGLSQIQPGNLALVLHAGQARLGVHLDNKLAQSLGQVSPSRVSEGALLAF